MKSREEWILNSPEFLLWRCCCLPCTWFTTRSIIKNNFKTCLLHISRVIFERLFYNIWQDERNRRLSLSQLIFLALSRGRYFIDTFVVVVLADGKHTFLFNLFVICLLFTPMVCNNVCPFFTFFSLNFMLLYG